MTTQNFSGVCVPELRRMLVDADGLAVTLNISNVQTAADQALTFDVQRVEATKAGGFMLTCQYPDCAVSFESGRPDAKYHTDNCRLRDHRRRQKLEAAELIAAANETTDPS